MGAVAVVPEGACENKVMKVQTRLFRSATAPLGHVINGQRKGPTRQQEPNPCTQARSYVLAHSERVSCSRPGQSIQPQYSLIKFQLPLCWTQRVAKHLRKKEHKRLHSPSPRSPGTLRGMISTHSREEETVMERFRSCARHVRRRQRNLAHHEHMRFDVHQPKVRRAVAFLHVCLIFHVQHGSHPADGHLQGCRHVNSRVASETHESEFRRGLPLVFSEIGWMDGAAGVVYRPTAVTRHSLQVTRVVFSGGCVWKGARNNVRRIPKQRFPNLTAK